MLVSLSEGGRVYVGNVGPADDRALGGRTPVLLLHGFMGSSATWPPTLLKELGRERSVWAVDLPGHGQSDRSHDPARYKFERIASDLLGVLDALRIERADWIGYSMGGRIALGMAVQHPDRVRRLVLESTSPGLETKPERHARRVADEVLAQRLLSDNFATFVNEWMALPLFAGQRVLGPEWKHRERTRRLSNDPVALAACLRGLGTGSQPSFWGRLGSLTPKTLLLTGRSDPKFTALNERMKTQMPDAQVSVVAGAAHAVHVEQTGDWLARVKSFLEGASVPADRADR